MTDSEYRAKQRILIGVFTLGAIIILGVFIYSMRERFARLEVDNPVNQLPEDSFSEWSEIQNSINDLTNQLEEESESTSTESEIDIEENSSESEEIPPDINRFLEE